MYALRYMKYLAIAYLLLVLTACAAMALPEGIPQMGVPGATTLAATTTATLSSSEITTALHEAGDLTAGLAPGEPTIEPPEVYAFLPEADALVFQPFNRQAAPRASVTVSFYKSTYMYEQAEVELRSLINRAAEVRQLAIANPENVGERASFLPPNALGIGPQLLFVRCHTITLITLEPEQADQPAILAYAQRLDHLIRRLACE